MEEDKDFLRQDNNYRSLKAFQKAECIYDVTFYFAHKYLKAGDRTIDQMVQAARSGKQRNGYGGQRGQYGADRYNGQYETDGQKPIQPIKPNSPKE